MIVTDNDRSLLVETMAAFNAACGDIVCECLRLGLSNKYAVQKSVYRHIRNKHKLSSQMCIRAIARACEAMSVNRLARPKFSVMGSVPYDSRMVTLKDAGPSGSYVSILTLSGRIKVQVLIPECFSHHDVVAIRHAVLVYKEDSFHLHVSSDAKCDPVFDSKDVIGVDMGVKNIAVDSDGEFFSGDKVEINRKRLLRLRSSLQSRGTKSAKRKLKKLSGREHRFRTNVNHCVSKRIVEKAKGSERAIAIEDLSGINDRITARHVRQSGRMGWSFFQLRKFIEYKSLLMGVRVLVVCPRYTSQSCSKCGHTTHLNRTSQDKFVCISCGHTSNADFNASKNIRSKGLLSISLLASASCH